MSFPLFNQIADSLITVFGNRFILALVVISFILFMLLIIKMPKVGIIMILAPLIIVMAGYGASSFIAISGNFDWLPLAIFIILGLLLAVGFFWKFIEG